MRRRLNYANVTATLALFFAMSGGALAAKHYLVSSTKQISPKVLRALKGNAGAKGATGAAGAAGLQGKEGPAGKTGANGERGPSSAFNTNSGTNILSFPGKANEKLTVATLNLPAGNFTVLGKLIANNNSTTIPSVNCELLIGGTVIDPGFDVVRLGKEGEQADRQYIVLSGEGSLSSPGAADIVCTTTTTEGNYLDRSITAVQVGSVG